MESVLNIKNATKSFKNNLIFQNVNLTIEKGKGYGFIGPNGSGKSILFKCICGLSKLTSGQIVYQNQIIGKDQDFIHDAGVIIETPEFINDLSGFRNLKIIADIKKSISNQEIYDTLKLLGLYEYRNVKVGKYSLGMKQKLRLAQSFMENPSILILDEPMNGLDKSSIKLVRELIKSRIENGSTLLLTSHNREDIDYLCDEIYEIDNHSILPEANTKN